MPAAGGSSSFWPLPRPGEHGGGGGVRHRVNTHSRCAGNCYIEDESTYGTFHIGFGRNIALGGVQDASGHYDLVTHAPCIYVDNRMIMDHGQLTVLEPSIYI